MWKLHVSLEPLWQELSECIGVTESQLGQGSLSSVVKANVGDPPLPLGTQRLLPFIEAFMGTVTFPKFIENHSRLLNAFVRQDLGLLEKSLSILLKARRVVVKLSLMGTLELEVDVGGECNDVSDIPDLTFSMDADEEKYILYEKTKVSDYEPNLSFSELIPRELISIFNDKELELLNNGLPEINLNDLQANTEFCKITSISGYTAASNAVTWLWEVVKAFKKEDRARLLQFVTGTSKVKWPGFVEFDDVNGKVLTYSAQDRLVFTLRFVIWMRDHDKGECYGVRKLLRCWADSMADAARNGGRTPCNCSCLMDGYFGDESAEVVILSLRLGDDQGSLFTNSNCNISNDNEVAVGEDEVLVTCNGTSTSDPNPFIQENKETDGDLKMVENPDAT
ncbi:E3 ubiquitin protein ligase UPL1-like protein isoform X1 [Tanacetum coccineum]